MIKLKEVIIHKYKCIEVEQDFKIEDDITILVGMNESGKTSILEAIAKVNYFTEDKNFLFNDTHDYPRRTKKKMKKEDTIPDAITCKYEISDGLIEQINEDIGEDLFNYKELSRTTDYENIHTWNNIKIDNNKFIDTICERKNITSQALVRKLKDVKTKEEFENLILEYKDEKIISILDDLRKYFIKNWKFGTNPIEEYVIKEYLEKYIPKFLYYDEYYALPSRISIEELMNESLENEEQKTAKALFELAEIDIHEILDSEDFEDYKAELEATEAIITDELFDYWSTNKNLEIKFDIDKVEKTDKHDNTRIVEHILDIRVRNKRAYISLPLKRRSKGFNWFFSFLVWFKKIQEDKSNNYILLLDEPGLNLHASAQADLLRFLEDLSNNYQIIYTTHSPFMIKSEKLNRVRTVLETEKGSIISESIQEKDPKTLFPLQAALGYDIAQNLFINKKNLLVEGVSDLIYLQTMSGLLDSLGKESLNDEISIVPIGGLDKVSTFISLMRGSSLDILCLLDSSIDDKSKEKMNKVISEKIITKSKVLYYDQFLDKLNEADIEDLFEKEDYIKLFNIAFPEIEDISLENLNPKIDRIILQINKLIGSNRFNHYRPANTLLSLNIDKETFSKNTILRFEELFKTINIKFR